MQVIELVGVGTYVMTDDAMRFTFWNIAAKLGPEYVYVSGKEMHDGMERQRDVATGQRPGRYTVREAAKRHTRWRGRTVDGVASEQHQRER